MKTFDIVILTESKYVDVIPTTDDWYTKNVLHEDGLVQAALEKLGLRVAKKDWADPEFDWSSTHYALFRTTWDYHQRFEAFSSWMNLASTQTILLNSPDQIRWNIDKLYLRDLGEKGINVTPTVYIRPGNNKTLSELHREQNWSETVIKPTISAAARHTYRLNENNRSEHEQIFKDVVSRETMMLQPFQYSIMQSGEISLMIFGGQFTHAVIKRAKEGDFRVQDDFGGTVEIYEASPEQIAFAERVIEVCDPKPIYARVDIIWDNDNNLALSELELIEPELWFRHYPAAADSLASAIKALF